MEIRDEFGGCAHAIMTEEGLYQSDGGIKDYVIEGTSV
jgi:hypothetical protein